jgi:tetratricopeptide (TPR) repeat protein
MPRQVDDAVLNLLYHELGTDLVTGLRALDAHFRQAEADYRIRDLEALLGLLEDQTLQDPRRLAWHHYYAARKSLLRWDLTEASRLLSRTVQADGSDVDPLRLRLALLDGQLHVMQGAWAPGVRAISKVYAAILASGEAALILDAALWLAHAQIGRAQSSGDWQAGGRSIGRTLWWIMQVALLFPLYLLLFLFLWLRGAGAFWRAVLHYGADQSNWPIFSYYLHAYRTLSQAIDAVPAASGGHLFTIKVMQADVLRRVGAMRAAAGKFAALLEGFQEDSGSAYQRGLIQHGLGRTYLLAGKRSAAKESLAAARAIYKEFEDERGAAHVDLLLGDLAAQEGLAQPTLDLWSQALRVFQSLGDELGSAEAINRFYAALAGEAQTALRSLETRQTIRRLLNTLPIRVYTVRMPEPLFRLILQLGWLVPAACLLLGALYTSRLIAGSSREELIKRSAEILSLASLLKTLLMMAGLLLVNSVFGLIGLLTTLWQDASRLDVFSFASSGEGTGAGTVLRRSNFLGVEMLRLSCAEISAYVRVERALWWRPTPALSFEYVCTRDGAAVRIPGTMTRFDFVQQDLERCAPVAPTVYRFRWYGGVAVFATPFVLAAAALLTESPIPSLSVRDHAWLTMLLVAAGYVALSLTAASAILHYTHSGWQQRPGPFLPRLWMMVGLGMLALGTWGKNWVTLFAPLFLVCGATLAFLCADHARSQYAALSPRLAGMAKWGVLVGGLAVILWSALPIVVSYYAYTFSGAASKAHSDCTAPAPMPNRDRCFAAMRRAGELMTGIDPTFFAGYGYQGYASYNAGEYEAALDAFQKAIRYDNVSSFADYYFCLAMTLDRIETPEADEKQKRACSEFEARSRDEQSTSCYRLFFHENEPLPCS